ncbi:MAG TPA: response regulator [Saliniramus sp.]|nr:response regulator [Saliniramus sp.]
MPAPPVLDPDLRFAALIVDADEASRNLAAALVEEVGLVPVGCDCAASALEALHRDASRIALVFTDARLPGEIGGIGLACEVEERWPDVSLLITSKFHRNWLGRPATATFIRKPWLALQVLIEAEKSLQAARLRQQETDVAAGGIGDSAPAG